MIADSLVTFWEHILSRSIERRYASYETRTEEEQIALLAHFQGITTHPNWPSEKAHSANTALRTIAKKPNEIS